jgi:hypothetical protein
MINKKYAFRSFRELQQERIRMEAFVKEEEDALMLAVSKLKNDFSFLDMAFSMLQPRKSSPSAKNILSRGASLLTSLFVTRKAGLIARLLLPPAIGRVASIALNNRKPFVNLLKKAGSFLLKKKSKP